MIVRTDLYKILEVYTLTRDNWPVDYRQYRGFDTLLRYFLVTPSLLDLYREFSPSVV